MQIHEALSRASKDAGWTSTRLAVAAGVTEGSARRWLTGRSIPSGDKLERLRGELPGLGRLLDRKA